MTIFPPISRIRNLGVAVVHSSSVRSRTDSRKAKGLEAYCTQRKPFEAFKISLVDCPTSATNGNHVGDYLPHTSTFRMIMIKQETVGLCWFCSCRQIKLSYLQEQLFYQLFCYVCKQASKEEDKKKQRKSNKITKESDQELKFHGITR